MLPERRISTVRDTPLPEYKWAFPRSKTKRQEGASVNIVVCVKQIVDSSVPVEIDGAANDISSQDVAWMLNPADLAAVRLAAAVRAVLNEGEVIALTIGPGQADAVLRKSMAFGAGRAVRLDAQGVNLLDANAVAHLLNAAVRHLEAALVLCGTQAADTMGGQTGAALAGLLEWPIVSSVTEAVQAGDNRSLVLRRRLDGGRRQVVEVDLPAVVACVAGDAASYYPSLPQHRASLEAPIQILKPLDLGVTPMAIANVSHLKVIGITPPKPRPKKIFTPDSTLSAADRIKQIMSGGLTQRQSDTLEGSPRDVAAALVRQLRQRKAI